MHNLPNQIASIPLFTHCFYNAIRRKVEITGYVQINTYFQHYSAKERRSLLEELNSPELFNLLQRSESDETKLYSIIEEIHLLQISETQISLWPENTCHAIISWLLYCAKQKYAGAILHKLSRLCEERYSTIKCIEDKYIVRDDVEPILIKDICSYIQTVLQLKPSGKLFYRGQSSLNYWIRPSIYRTALLEQKESTLYQELLLRCPTNFQNCHSHLDYLVEMQHYSLPTRLLDLTSNPLVALYFSCGGKSNESGEVILFDTPNSIQKYTRSDTVSILSCLPLLSHEDQRELLSLVNAHYKSISQFDFIDFNSQRIVHQLLQEIRTEKPAFVDRIIPNDLCTNLVITPTKMNNRIIRQSGAFFICGLINYAITPSPLEKYRYREKKQRQPLLIIENKPALLRELNSMDINEASLFPEIDNVASFLTQNI